MSATLEHNALIYDSEDNLITAFGEAASAAVARGEQVLVSVDTSKKEKLAAVLGEISGSVIFVEAGRRYIKPATAMSALSLFIRDALDDGCDRMLALGEIPPVRGEVDRAAWLRYEAAVNDVLAHTPLRAICAYHRGLGTDAVEAAHRVHPQIEVGGRTSVSSTYMTPTEFMAHQPKQNPAPGRVPDLTFDGVTRALPIRAALTELSHPRRRGEICLVVTELLCWLTREPKSGALVEVWREGERVVVTVTGRVSPSRSDLFPDFRTPPSIGESGMRISGELADRFTISPGPEGALAITVVFEDSSLWPVGG